MLHPAAELNAFCVYSVWYELDLKGFEEKVKKNLISP